MMDKVATKNYEGLSLKKAIKQGKREIINKYDKKIHRLLERKGDEQKLAKWKSKAEKLQQEINTLKKIKADAVCRMVLSKDKDWKNILSEEGVSLKDKCHALIADHSQVRATLEMLFAKSSSPMMTKIKEISISTESCAVKPHKRRKKKKDQLEERPKEVKSPPRMMEFESDKENCETQINHSISMESDTEVIRLCADSEKRYSDVPDSKSGERHKSKKKLLEASKTRSSKKRKLSETEDPVVQEELEDDCSTFGNVPLKRKKSSKKKEKRKKEKKKPRKKRKHKSIIENSDGENPKQQDISPGELPQIIEFIKDDGKDKEKLENDCLMLGNVPLRRKKSSKKEVEQPMKAKVPGKKRKGTINDSHVEEYLEKQDLLPSELPEILESDDEKDPHSPFIRKRDSEKPDSKSGKKHKLKKKLLEVRETKSSKRKKSSLAEDPVVQEKLGNDCSILGNVPTKRKISSKKGLEEPNVPCKKRKTSLNENPAEIYLPDQDPMFCELPEVIELVEDDEKDSDPNSHQRSHKRKKLQFM